MPETPKAPERRDVRLVVRLSKSEKERIEHAAWEAHTDMSSWVRTLVLTEIDRREQRKRK